jgi:hypothetical protein
MDVRRRARMQLIALLAALVLLGLFGAYRQGRLGPESQPSFVPIATPPAPAIIPRIGR